MSQPTTVQPASPPASTVPGAAREWLAVDIGTDETLSTADLLRLLDGLRRELSCHLAGSPGAFIGYDSLTVPQGSVVGPGRVIVEARLTGRSERLHHVQYVAASVAPGAERPTASDRLLVRGTGRTLHVGC